MLNGVTMKINIDEYLLNTLKEDITSEDVSTNAVMPDDKQGKADLICKQNGVICGLDVFERTFKLLDETSHFEANFKDGDFVKKGDLLGVIYGDVKAILSGERTGLNYLQRTINLNIPIAIVNVSIYSESTYRLTCEWREFVTVQSQPPKCYAFRRCGVSAK